MATKKMTKKDYFNTLKTLVADNAELVAFIDRELALLEKKSSGTRKPTAIQLENEQLKADIMAYLTEVDTMKCIKELEQEIPSLNGRSNQKISRLLKALVDTGKLDRETVKKTPYFFIKR